MYTWEDWVDPRPVGEDDGEEGVEGPAHPDQPHLPPTQFKQFLATYSVMQSDRNSAENWHIWKGFNFWINDLILIMKTPIRLYLCLANITISSELV